MPTIQDLVISTYLDGLQRRRRNLISEFDLASLRLLANAAMRNRSPEIRAIEEPIRQGRTCRH